MISSIGNVHSPAGVEKNTKLRSSVQEFEAMLIADLLKMAGQEKEKPEPGMEGYEDMRIQGIATAMAAQGGIGIGKLLLNQLDRWKAGNQIKAFSDCADPIIAGGSREG